MTRDEQLKAAVKAARNILDAFPHVGGAALFAVALADQTERYGEANADGYEDDILEARAEGSGNVLAAAQLPGVFDGPFGEGSKAFAEWAADTWLADLEAYDNTDM